MSEQNATHNDVSHHSTRNVTIPVNQVEEEENDHDRDEDAYPCGVQSGYPQARPKNQTSSEYSSKGYLTPKQLGSQMDKSHSIVGNTNEEDRYVGYDPRKSNSGDSDEIDYEDCDNIVERDDYMEYDLKKSASDDSAGSDYEDVLNTNEDSEYTNSRVLHRPYRT